MSDVDMTFSIFHQTFDVDVFSHNFASDDWENEKIVESERQILDVTASRMSGLLIQGDYLLVRVRSYLKTNLGNEDEKHITIKLVVDKDVEIPVQFENLGKFVSIEDGYLRINRFQFWE